MRLGCEDGPGENVSSIAISGLSCIARAKFICSGPEWVTFLHVFFELDGYCSDTAEHFGD